MSNYKTYSDPELISKLKAGVAEAGDEIYYRYNPKVVNICCHYLHSPEDGQDAAQEVFFKILVLKKIFDFRGESSFWTWLRRVVINVCKEVIRRLSRIREIYLKPIEEDMEPLEEIIPSHELNPEQMCIQKEENEQIRDLVDQLPEKYCEVISASYLEELSYAEAAQKLDLSIQSLGVRLLRARRMLMKVFKQRWTLPMSRLHRSFSPAPEVLYNAA